jgi:hypothetical protein
VNMNIVNTSYNGQNLVMYSCEVLEMAAPVPEIMHGCLYLTVFYFSPNGE